MDLLDQKTEKQKNTLAVSLVVLACVLGFLLVAWHNGNIGTSKEAVVSSVKNIFLFGEKTTHETPLSESEPARLRIPDIYVDTNFVPLGLQDNGEIEIPKGYTEVGWYTYGPTPGELGPAIVLGHVDSYQGPGVFLFLGQLEVGDLVYVDRQDGTTAVFRVTALERYNRNAFPTEKVYGDTDYAGIRLITCTGTYSHETLEYDRVLVVYGELVDGTTAQ